MEYNCRRKEIVYIENFLYIDIEDDCTLNR